MLFSNICNSKYPLFSHSAKQGGARIRYFLSYFVNSEGNIGIAPFWVQT